jgi:phage protein D
MSSQLTPAFEVAVNAVKLPPAVVARVTSILVTHEPDSLDHFTLSVANEFPALPFTHGSDAGLFREGNAVTIKLGYVDALEQLFDGEVTRVTARFSDDAMPSVTIEGHSRLHRLRTATSTRTFQQATDGDIVRRIAQDNGLRAKVDPTPTTHPYVIQVNQSDFHFLLERARRLRFELLVDGKTLIFRRPADGKPKACTLVWGDTQRVSAASRTFALTQLQVTLDATQPVGAMTVHGMHPTKREAIVGRGAGGDEVDRNGATGASVAGKAFGRREAAVVDLPVASQAEADEIAKALFNERTLRLVSGSGACVGTPAVRAGAVVELGGIGPRFSGAYLVTQSTHELGPGGYRTRFSVRRGATG